MHEPRAILRSESAPRQPPVHLCSLQAEVQVSLVCIFMHSMWACGLDVWMFDPPGSIWAAQNGRIGTLLSSSATTMSPSSRSTTHSSTATAKATQSSDVDPWRIRFSVGRRERGDGRVRDEQLHLPHRRRQRRRRADPNWLLGFYSKSFQLNSSLSVDATWHCDYDRFEVRLLCLLHGH